MAVGTPENTKAAKRVVALVALSLVLLPFFDAHAESWTTRPTENVQAELATLLGCTWQTPTNPIQCYGGSLEVILVVIPDKIDGTIAQMTTGTVIVSYPRDRARETRSRETTAKLLAYLFPEWKSSSAWLTKALNKVRASYDDMPTSITVGGATIQVRWLETMQNDTYAQLTITKKGPWDGKP